MTVSTENIFLSSLEGKNTSGRLPVWMMRQAGRYHRHYQNLRKTHGFRDLCLNPDLACETTMGPIQDFDFDAAILFSDILFAIEACGPHVSYEEKGPVLSSYLRRPEDKSILRESKSDFFQFQKLACQRLREQLPASKGLIGFVGAPWTLFIFLTDGTHKGHPELATSFLKKGLFREVAPLLESAVLHSLRAQAEGGAQALQIFDTGAGHLPPEIYADLVAESHERVLKEAQRLCPHTIFFAKGIDDRYESIKAMSWRTLSVDWNWDLNRALQWVGPNRSIQGNVHPEILFQSSDDVARTVRKTFEPLKNCQRLVANLGHGILPKTPEENVRMFVKTLRSPM